MTTRQDFLIKGTATTPTISYDAESNHLYISGRSLPENAVVEYAFIHDWMKQHHGTFGQQMKVTVMLEYINSTSLKELSVFFLALDQEARSGTGVTVQWYYEEFDEDMKDTGYDLMDVFGHIRFEMVTLPEDDVNDMLTRSKLLLQKQS